jgi:adenylate cyclase
MLKKILLSPWTALFTLTLILGIRFIDPSFVESVRLRYFDQLVLSQPAKDIPVHTVNIDEAALDKYGQFPFPRATYGKIIQDIYDRGAGLVVFNVLMPEADRFNQDAQLAQIMSVLPTILPEVASTKDKNKTFGTTAQAIGLDPTGRLVDYPGIIANVPIIQERAAGVGVINTFPEVDGVVRRMPLVITSNGTIYPALALETMRVAAKDTKFQVKIGEYGVEALRVPKVGKIATDDLSRVWIDWSATPYEHSLVNLPKDFDGGIVIVGLSAAGLVQPVATAKGEVWPQYMQAALLGTMINGTTITRLGNADDLEIAALLVAGLLLLFLTRWTYAGLATTVVLGVGGVCASMYAYANYHYLFDATAFTVGVVLVALHAYGVKFVSEFLQKSAIKKQFGSYVNPVIVERLQKDPALLNWVVRKRTLLS